AVERRQLSRVGMHNHFGRGPSAGAGFVVVPPDDSVELAIDRVDPRQSGLHDLDRADPLRADSRRELESGVGDHICANSSADAMRRIWVSQAPSRSSIAFARSDQRCRSYSCMKPIPPCSWWAVSVANLYASFALSLAIAVSRSAIRPVPIRETVW